MSPSPQASAFTTRRRPALLVGASLLVLTAVGSTQAALAGVAPSTSGAVASSAPSASSAHPRVASTTAHPRRHPKKHPRRHQARRSVARSTKVAPAVTTGTSGTSALVGPSIASPSNPSATQLSAHEAQLVALVNQARVRAGIAPLKVSAGTTDVARRWSQQLSHDGALSHNPVLASALQNAGSPDWHIVAENVGTAPADQPDLLFAAYMASEHHRDNILDPRLVYIGMGTVQVTNSDGQGTAWNTMDFTDSYSSAYGLARTAP